MQSTDRQHQAFRIVMTDVATRERVHALIRRYGWNATAFQTLEEGYRYFFHGDHACVAYVAVRGAWVGAGAPIAPEASMAETARAFLATARANGRRCCFFAAEDRLFKHTAESFRGLRIGEQPVWTPARWSSTLTRYASLREQLRRARAKGVRVRKLFPAELESGPAHDAIARLANDWLATRRMPEMGFLVRLQPFTAPGERCCLVAEQNGCIVAFAAAIPVPARSGWFLEDIVRGPEAPNGTTELLIDQFMRWAADQGCPWVTLGMAPLTGDVGRGLSITRRLTRPLYDFSGVRSFKAKLKPDQWCPLYLAIPAHQSTVLSLVDAVSAFAPNGLLRFGARTALHRPDAVIWCLALLLIPWTAVLALAPVHPWYGISVVKWAWVAFDVCLACALFSMLRRPARKLAKVLGLAVTADALVTIAQALAWNRYHTASTWHMAVVLFACFGPAAAAVFLWRFHARLAVTT